MPHTRAPSSSLVRSATTSLALLAACTSSTSKPSDSAGENGGADSRASKLLAHVKVLASDEFEGRAPGTHGEDLTIAYLTGEFQRLGLAPGNADGSYVQKVPLVGLTCHPEMTLRARDREMSLVHLQDYVAVTRRQVDKVDVDDSPVVFVGYGVVAPEYGWDDYKGVDVKGKTIVMLVNDPPVPDPKDPSKLDEKMFKGRAMTYYGRWTYKYEIAAEKGAAAAIIVHETGPAGYGFEVVQNSWGREGFDIEAADKNMSRAAVEAWITLDKAKELFTACGQDFDALKKQAVSKDFRPVDLGARMTSHVKSELRRISSHNVVAALRGQHPELRDQWLVYTAHWDHLGRDPSRTGDQVFNGALDNASGCAALLEIAGAFAQKVKEGGELPRSILFLSVTGEEKGLLGSKYYAAHALHPLDHTLCDFNIDGLNPWGPTSDVVSVGYGNTTLDEVLVGAAAEQRRSVALESEPEKGGFYRSDHFEFCKVGVPALYLHSGESYIGRPPGYGKQKSDEFVAHDYHQVTDEVKPDWDFSGGALDVDLLFDVGLRVARGDHWPEWKPGSEFKARRDAMLHAAR
jgi:Zn-dependent M28 family amino/carboxypeptidase